MKYVLTTNFWQKENINSNTIIELIAEIATAYGSQCVVLAIDTLKKDEHWSVFVSGGRKDTGLDTLEWAKKGVELGAGEILLTSMNQDGTKDGFALDVVQAVADTVNVPVIASGGAGQKEDFVQLFNNTSATAGLAASIFHFNTIQIPDLKNYLKSKNISVR